MHKKLSKLLLFCPKQLRCNLRIWGIGVVCLASFGLLVARFYQLQIIDHMTYAEDLRVSTQREIKTTAQRGEIYDRYGEPLAVNQPVSNLYYRPNIELSEEQLNSLLLQLMNLLENNGDTLVDEVPISLDQPFKYTKDQTSLNQYTYQIPYQNESHRKILLTYTAEELINYLQDIFKIPKNLEPIKVRQLIAMRSQIYSCTYRQYEDVILSRNISVETISYLKENDEHLPNLVVYNAAQRFYPLGNMASNILGYTRPLTSSQFNSLKDNEYSISDVMGQMGIEKSLEERLRGKNGKATIEVDNMGREMRVLHETESIKGEDVYLTIDASLQKAIYAAVEKRLSEALIIKLKSPDTYGITGKDLLISLITCHGLDCDFVGDNTPYLDKLKKRLELAYDEIDPLMRNKVTRETLIASWLNEEPMNEGVINEIIMALDEEGVMQLDEAFLKKAQQGGRLDLTALFIDQLERGVMTPGQMAVDPFSAVAAMIDVTSGEVLSLVDYPSYDNNKMVNAFNAYWEEVSSDARSLLWQRSLKTLKAPGSTFKMVTALAGLEENCITNETVIDDTGIYKDAGKPYPKCWYYTNYGNGHGPLNLKGAIGASCNYYFYEVAHRLETQRNGIESLSQYMKKLGLTERTGIELEEEAPCASIPEVVVKNKINTLVDSLVNLGDADRKELIARDITNLSKDFDLRGEAISASKEVNDIYEENLKKNLEPILQERLEDGYEKVLNSVYDNLIQYMASQPESIRQELVTEILAQTDLSKREETAHYAVYNLLDRTNQKMLDEEIQKEISKIPSNILLDAYEKALTKAYRKLVREDDESEELKVLNETIKHLSRHEGEIREKLILKFRQNLLNAIVNNLLNGVELDWTEGITVRTAIGQGYNAFSPLQVLRYVGAVANGETLERLTVVQGSQGKGEALGFKSENIKAVQEGMLSVTVGEEGTAKGQFDNLPVQVAAKTGTAEEGSHEHSYIVAFAPYEKPKIALIVAIYNADGLGRYSTLIANDMLLSYFGLQNKQESITLANTWME